MDFYRSSDAGAGTCPPLVDQAHKPLADGAPSWRILKANLGPGGRSSGPFRVGPPGLCYKLNRMPSAAFVTTTGGKRIVASKADEYRRRAQQWLEMAGTFRDHEARATLSHMAQAWLRLADNYKADANERVPRSKAAEEGQPVVQQQQQIQPKKLDL
jgi:hypothetical protein